MSLAHGGRVHHTSRKGGVQVQNKNIVRIVLATAVILLIPVLAMQFTDEVAWNLTDFAVAGALLIGTGLFYELLASKMGNSWHRAILGVMLAAALLLIWIELAAGIFGTPFSGQ